jgi:hypothetical protein
MIGRKLPYSQDFFARSRAGCKGVTIFKNKQYRVDVAVGGKRMYFGLYPLTEEGFQKAKAVRQLAEELYWEHPE